MYPEELVMPMKKQLTDYGFEELVSIDDVENMIKVNLGSNQGINLGNLALSESRDTPFSVFEVVDVGPNQSSLMPLNLSRNIKNYYGKTITFMEF